MTDEDFFGMAIMVSTGFLFVFFPDQLKRFWSSFSISPQKIKFMSDDSVRMWGFAIIFLTLLLFGLANTK
jgi:hypothetical protein